MDLQKHKIFSVDELLDNFYFIFLVKNIELKKDEWNSFIKKNKESKDNILYAKEIVLLFQEKQDLLDKTKREELWSRLISNDIITQPYSLKIKPINVFYRVAASIAVIAVLAGVFYSQFRKDSNYHFSLKENAANIDNSLLVLSNGEKYELNNKESVVEVLKKQKAVVINKDSVVSAMANNSNTKDASAYNEIMVPYGKKSKILLADGTQVWLNAGSRLAFPTEFNGKKREVFLEGEGYFEVSSDKKHPFIVNTKNIDIEVVGTNFNVSAYDSDDNCEAVLLKGVINVVGKGKLINKKVLMHPNQRLKYNNTKNTIALSEEQNAELSIAWIDGWYPFNNEDITNVLAKIERYYNVNIKFDSNLALKALPISGKIDFKDSLQDVLDVISRISKVNYMIGEDGTVTLK